MCLAVMMWWAWSIWGRHRTIPLGACSGRRWFPPLATLWVDGIRCLNLLRLELCAKWHQKVYFDCGYGNVLLLSCKFYITVDFRYWYMYIIHSLIFFILQKPKNILIFMFSMYWIEESRTKHDTTDIWNAWAGYMYIYEDLGMSFTTAFCNIKLLYFVCISKG